VASHKNTILIKLQH